MQQRGAAEYVQRLTVNSLRRAVFEQPDPTGSVELLDKLQAAETILIDLEDKRAEDPDSVGVIVDSRSRSQEVRGAGTTGLDTRAVLRMAQVPTSVYHLLDQDSHPLIACTVRNVGDRARRLRITSHIDGYSARAVDTVELETYDEVTVNQLPTLFPEPIRHVHELTAATVNVLVEDLDGQVELNRTQRVPLLARTTVPLAVLDPASNKWVDLSRYLGAFVTPNAPAITAFLRQVADHTEAKLLAGYQGARSDVTTQVRAVFDALKAAGITYISSLVAFSPEEGTSTQRVRLPTESLTDRAANCIDGTVLVASILEAMTLTPAIVIVPGHAFVGWETRPGSDEWRYLETTMIGSGTFTEACASADETARRYKSLADHASTRSRFHHWPLPLLRTTHHIIPME